MSQKSLQNAKDIATHFCTLVRVPHQQMIHDRITRWNICITKLLNLNVQQKLLLLQNLSPLEQRVCLKEINNLQTINNMKNKTLNGSIIKKHFKNKPMKQQQTKEKYLTEVVTKVTNSQQMLVSKQSLRSVCKKQFGKRFSNKLFKKQKLYK